MEERRHAGRTVTFQVVRGVAIVSMWYVPAGMLAKLQFASTRSTLNEAAARWSLERVT